MSTATFTTHGMHCSSCSMLITMNLEDLAGVQSVDCNYAKGSTQVSYDPSLVNEEQIREAIVAAGYDAELVR